VLTLLLTLLALGACAAGHEDRLLRGDHAALLAACRRAMASLPPPGPAIDPTVYSIDPADTRWQRLSSTLYSRTVEFAAKGQSPWVSDPGLPPEILELEPLFVTVTPDAVHIALCGAGLSCSADAVREGIGIEALSNLKGGEPDCKALLDGLWYCHE
jgi:hypothetical protein